VGWGVAAVLLSGWVLWISCARITVYAVSPTARLEATGAARPAECTVQGRIITKSVALGQVVKAGDLLVVLDGESDRRRLAVEHKRIDALRPQVAALTRELAATEDAARQDRSTMLVTLEQRRALQAAAEVAAKFSGDEADRLAKLQQTGGVPELDALRTRAEAQKRRSASEAEVLESQRLVADQRTRESQTRAHQEELRRDLALTSGQIATTTATIELLEEELRKMEVRAPVAGVVAEVTPLAVGAVVRAGERIAQIVPKGTLEVIAEFAPPEALGRIRAGQVARLRLDGFPWTQYGSVPALVRSVASEAPGGSVRVELDIDPAVKTAVPLQHGLPGSIEVAIEEVSPLSLILRATGELLHAPSARGLSPAPLR